MKFPLVSIIVLNYNGLLYLGDLLKKCMDSILETDYPSMEIVFVDNVSVDGSLGFIEELYDPSEVRVVSNNVNVIAEGYNRGIRVSRGKYIAIVENDMIFDRNWLKPIIELMEKDARIGIATSKRIVNGTEDTIESIGSKLSFCGRVVPIAMYERDKGQHDTVRLDLDHVGGTLVVRRKTFDEIGLFDPDYVLWFEDVDLCARARKKGYKIAYVPESVVWHRTTATINKLDPSGLFLQYMTDRSRGRFAIIHFPLPRLLATFLIDGAFLLASNGTSKRLMLKAYWWNLRKMPITLKARLQYGPSPCGYANSITGFPRSAMMKRLREIQHARMDASSNA